MKTSKSSTTLNRTEPAHEINCRCIFSLESACPGLFGETCQCSFTHSHAASLDAAPDRGWPHPIPLRVRDGANRSLMVMTLGAVKTSLADGIYDPVTDKATLKDGSVIANHYRDKLGVKYSQPIHKTNFPCLPRAGVPGITTTSRLTKMRSSKTLVESPRTSKTTARNTFR